jgi:hypothetical protein
VKGREGGEGTREGEGWGGEGRGGEGREAKEGREGRGKIGPPDFETWIRLLFVYCMNRQNNAYHDRYATSTCTRNEHGGSQIASGQYWSSLVLNKGMGEIPTAIAPRFLRSLTSADAPMSFMTTYVILVAVLSACQRGSTEKLKIVRDHQLLKINRGLLLCWLNVI